MNINGMWDLEAYVNQSGRLSIISVNLNNCQSLPKGFIILFLLICDFNTCDMFIFGNVSRYFSGGDGELLC